MYHKQRLISGLALLIGLSMILGLVDGTQDAIRVGTCNPSLVFEKLDERKVVEDKIKLEREKFARENVTKQNELKDLRGQRDALNPNSVIFQEKTQTLLTKAIEYEVWVKLKELELIRQERENIIRLYKLIEEGCTEVGKQKGLNLVFAERKPQLPENRDQLTADQVRALLGQNDVLFSDGKADITNDVITVMNKKFAGGGVARP